MDENIKKICELLNIELIPDNRNYWLIRTGSGKFFSDFLKNNYVSIGWDEFNSKEDFMSMDEKKIKEQISKKYPDEKRPGYIYNQIKRFMFDIKIGDMVLIPSENSSQIAFGIITKDFFVREIKNQQNTPNSQKCFFKKCIKVEWKTKILKNNFDPYLKMLMFTHTTISDVNDYKDYINRALYPMYSCNGKLHIIFNVLSKNNISLINLTSFLSSIDSYTKIFSDYIDININSNDLNVKVSVQSPGPIEIFGNIYNFATDNFSAILVLALILNYIVGGSMKFTKTSKKEESEIGSDGLIEKILKLKKESNKQKNKEKQLELEAQRQQFEQQLELLKITNPAQIDTPKKLLNEEINPSEDTFDKEN